MKIFSPASVGLFFINIC